MPGPTVSVLMSVYAGTPAQHLDAALGSVVGQTRRADEIVLVVDGPVSSEHEAALAKYGGAIKRVDLPHNVGLGRALDAGMAACSGDWIARADADDVNRADRLEHQLAVLERTGADVCSASMQEVDGPSMQPVGVRRSPSTHDEFARRMRMTNPVNHPAVMFRREAAASAGGYRHLPLLEDYDLWARMLRDGARFVGVDEPLVTYRIDGMLDRRADPSLAASERELRQNLRDYKLIGWPAALRNSMLRGAYRNLPAGLRARAYAVLFRSRDDEGGGREALRGAGKLTMAGVAAAGLGWITLLLVARWDTPATYAAFAVIWAVYYALAGALAGLQQEVTRSVVRAQAEVERTVEASEPRQKQGSSLLGSTLVFGASTAILVTVTYPWWRGTLDEGWALLVPLTLGTLTLTALILMLGVLAAQERWGIAALLLMADAIVRLVCTGLVALLDGSLFWYLTAIVSGSIVWVPLLLSRGHRTRELVIRHRDPRLLVRASAAIVATAGASLLIAGMPWLFAMTSRAGQGDLSPGILAALILFRSPVLVVAQGFRPVVLRQLVSEGADVGGHVRRAFVGYGVAAAVAALLAWGMGPAVLRLTFGDSFDVSAVEASVLALSAVLLALAAHLTVALVAIVRHRRGSEGWLAAVVATLLTLLLPIDGSDRLLWAALVGPTVGLVYLTIALATTMRRRGREA